MVGGEKVGRYSFLATEPFFEIEAYGNRVTTNAYSGVSAGGTPTLVTRQFECDNPLDELRRRVEAVRAVHLPELPPFCSGAVGYAGYDTVRYFEHLPNAPPDDRQVPDLAFAFYDQMVVFDNVTKTIVVVAMARLDKPGVDAGQGLRRRLPPRRPPGRRACPRGPATCSRSTFAPPGEVTLPYRSNFTQADFEAAVRQVRRVHPRRRHLPGRPQPAAGSAAPRASLRDLPHAAGGQPQPVHVLRPHAQRDAGRQFAGGHGPRGRSAQVTVRPWPAPAAAARPRRKTAAWPRNCWPIRRSGPST